MLKLIGLLIVAVLEFSNVAHATLSWTSSGPGGGGAFGGAAVSVDGSVIVPSDLGGVYRSTNGGATWSPIGSISNGLMSTHVDVVVFHPSIDGTVFLGTSEGIFRSTNCHRSPVGSCTFTRPIVNGSSGSPNHLVAAIGLASTGTENATVVYAAGLDGWCDAGQHFYKSNDNGTSWTETLALGLPANANIMAIRVQPGNARNIVVISAASRFTGCGLASRFPLQAPNQAFRSTDGGFSFVPLTLASTTTPLLQSDTVSRGNWAYVEDVKFDSADPNKIWATVTANPNIANHWEIDGELWMSDGKAGFADGFKLQSNKQTGQIWPLSSGAIRVVDLRRQRPWDLGQNGFWEFSAVTKGWTRITTDTEFSRWGRGWHGLTNGPGGSLNGHLHSITPVNDKVLWWTDGQFVYKTTDGGHTVSQQFTNVPLRTAGGYRSRKIDNAVAGVLAPSPVNADVLYTGYFDLGCWRSQDAGRRRANPSWINCNGPKSPSPNFPNTLLNGSWHGFGGNVTGIAPDPNFSGTLWAVHAAHKEAAGSRSLGFYRIAKSTNSGSTWKDVTSNLNTTALASHQAITDLLVQAPDAKTRHVWAIAGKNLYRLANASSTWSHVKTPCDGGLMVLAQSGARMLAGGGAGVCWSGTSGKSWKKWQAPWSATEVNNWWEDGQLVAGIYTKYHGVTDFAFHPIDKQIAWMTVAVPNLVASEASAGLYKTINGGVSWAKVTTLPATAARGMNFARTVAVSPKNANLLVVGNSTALISGGLVLPNDQTGVWVSTNGGASWSPSPQNAGLAFPFMTRLRFTGGAVPRLWGVSPGQGPVFTMAP